MRLAKGMEIKTELNNFLEGVKACIPTLLGYLSIGFAAGVVERTAGLSMLEIALMSLLLYAGSAQFIAAAMIMTNAPIPAIVFTIFFVNLRHLLMSAALSPYFRNLSPGKNTLIGALLTDETFGVAMTQAAHQKQIDEKWMHGLNITAYLNWFVANMAGAYFGNWITEPEQFGLDFALPAMFIGLLIIQLIERKKYILDLIVLASAVIVAVVFSMYFSPSMGIIVAIIVGATIGLVVEKWK